MGVGGAAGLESGKDIGVSALPTAPVLVPRGRIEDAGGPNDESGPVRNGAGVRRCTGFGARLGSKVPVAVEVEGTANALV